MDPVSTRHDVAHLVRRAAFGGHADEIDSIAERGYDAAVEAMCDTTSVDAAAESIVPPELDLAASAAARYGDLAEKRAARQQIAEHRRAMMLWWLQRMALADHPHREKTALLWHDHFATSVQKVKRGDVMQRQRSTLYDLGNGRFDALAAAMVRDPAMLVWLDGRESTARSPNENFAREFLELFTLGHGATGHHGSDGAAAAQPYTERDVAEAARAFTGWTLRPAQPDPVLDARRHDAGTKTVLGTTGALGTDEVVAIATAHPACAPHVVARLWSRLARPVGPDDPVVVELAEPFAEDLDIAALRRRMFLHPEFLAAETRTALVKTPIELVVGAARALRVPLDRRHLRALAMLGQVPFAPPDVAGWPANEGWLSTSSALVRLELATMLAAVADLGQVVDQRASERPDGLARWLGVGEWGRTTRATLIAADDPRDALTLALVAPEHLLA